MKIFSDLDLPFDLDHTFFFFFVVHAIAKTVHTISSTKFQRYILMNNVTGSLIILLWPYLQFLPQYLLFCDYKPKKKLLVLIHILIKILKNSMSNLAI